MSFKRLLSSAFVVGLIALTPAKAATVTISVGDGWHDFGFGGVGSNWSNSFAFTLLSTATLRVTDAFLSGDRFNILQILPTSVSLGQTSAPGSSGDQVGGNYDAAFADSRWSSGSFVFGPGSYEVTGTVTASPFGGGGGAVQLVAGGVASAVPEPATWAMMLIGFAGLGLASRRKQALAVA